MNPSKFLVSFPLVIIAICLTENRANAAYFSSLTGYTKQALEQDIQKGIFVEEFSASSFIGDNGMTAYELELKNIIPPDNINSLKTEQFFWKNQQQIDFELSFDGTTLSYKLGDKVVRSIDVVDQKFNIDGMILSANSTKNSLVTVSNLMFEDGSMSMKNLLARGESVDFIKITGLDHNFKLTGIQTFSWWGERPSNSELAYQIRVGSFHNPSVASNQNRVDIPEPQTVSLLSIGAIALFLGKVRKKI